MDLTQLEPDDPRVALLAAREKKRRRTYIGLVGACIVALVALIVVSSLTGGDTAHTDVLPATRLTTLDGQVFDLIELRGEPTVINFFASWCAPCRAEMPDFEAVYRQRGDEVRFVGINANETDLDAARALVATTGVTYEVLLGADNGLMESLDGPALPMTLFVDSDGVIVDRYVGVLRPANLTERIDALLQS